MRGTAEPIQWWFDSTLFSKAAVNGMDRAYRGLIKDDNRWKVRGKVALAATMNMAAYTMLLRGNPLYETLDDRDRAMYHHLLVPKFGPDGANAVFQAIEVFNNNETVEDSSGQSKPKYSDAEKAEAYRFLDTQYYHPRIPIAFEAGTIVQMATAALRNFLDVQDGVIESGDAMARFTGQAGRLAKDQFSLMFMPHIVQPLVEVGLNRISYWDRPIETQSMKAEPKLLRSSPYGSSFLRDVGRFGNRHVSIENQNKYSLLSPAEMEAIIKGYGNTAGMYALMGVDAIWDAAKGGDQPPERTKKWSEQPIFRRFIQQHPPRGTGATNRLYDILEVGAQFHHATEQARKRGNKELWDNLLNVNLEDVPVRHHQRIRQQLSRIREAKLKNEEAPDLAATRRISEELQTRGMMTPGELITMQGQELWSNVGLLKQHNTDVITLFLMVSAERLVREHEEAVKEYNQ
jgi:hypothetical protein